MSQAGIINTQSGPPPPPVPTSFVTQNGTSVPLANVEIINGFETNVNNTNGISTAGGVVGTGTQNEVDILLTNRNSVSSTTSDGGGQTQTVGLISMTNGTAISFRTLVTGYDIPNNIGVGGETVGIARCSGGIVTVIGTNDTFDESDAALNTSDWELIGVGNALGVQFIGVASHTINWRCLFEYTQAP